jgi:hypothetical protein
MLPRLFSNTDAASRIPSAIGDKAQNPEVNPPVLLNYATAFTAG